MHGTIPLRWILFPPWLYSAQLFPAENSELNNDMISHALKNTNLLYATKMICKYLMIYSSSTCILTNNLLFGGTYFNCFISPCINYAVVFKWWTRKCHFFTAFPCSCFDPFLVVLRTWFHYLCCCCWVIVAFIRIHKNLQNEVFKKVNIHVLTLR